METRTSMSFAPCFLRVLWKDWNDKQKKRSTTFVHRVVKCKNLRWLHLNFKTKGGDTIWKALTTDFKKFFLWLYCTWESLQKFETHGQATCGRELFFTLFLKFLTQVSITAKKSSLKSNFPTVCCHNETHSTRMVMIFMIATKMLAEVTQYLIFDFRLVTVDLSFSIKIWPDGGNWKTNGHHVHSVLFT